VFQTTTTFRSAPHFLFQNYCWPSARRMATVLVLLLSPLVATTRAMVIDFDDPSLSLATNSYWNGSDGTGGFTSRGVYFGNSYTDFGGGYVVWDGWSYSNVKNTTTPGFANQYASYAGTGAGGSANYALGYIDLYDGVLPSIAIPNGMQVQSAAFTNTTYAGLSMLYGDQYAKQFGPTDWFKLTITGENAAGSTIGLVNFYLAQNGSIVNTWQLVDLSSLSAAKTLTFSLTSSDNGAYGMNTPAYFAMDNLTLSAVPEPSMLVLICGAGIARVVWGSRQRRLFRPAPPAERNTAARMSYSA